MVTETVRVWLVERTYSDDEQNLVITVYATPDGSRYLRREIALTSDRDARETSAALDVAPSRLADVTDPGLREVYASAVADTRLEFGADDVVGGGPQPEY